MQQQIEPRKTIVEDEWKDPNSLLTTFRDNMRVSDKKGNPSATIDITDLPIGTEIVIEKP
jgi:hypothetical protein